MARIWNITDHPGTDFSSTVMMVLGRSIRPGRSINVPDEMLVRAHKVHKTVAAGKLYIGNQPPADYMAAKRPAKAELAEGVARSHGLADMTQIAAEAPEKLSAVLGEDVEAKDKVEVEKTATPDEAQADQTPSEDKGRSSKKRNRGRS